MTQPPPPFTLHPIPSPLSSASLYPSLPTNLGCEFWISPLTNIHWYVQEEISAGVKSQKTLLSHFVTFLPLHTHF